MVSPGSSNVWSYQTFAENHDMSKASTPFPHVILRLSHVKFTDGTEVNEPRFVVVSGFATPSGMPNAMFAGRIYSTGDNLVFDERHIVVDPNLNIITLQINVELHLWYGITTIPETPFTQPNPRHVTITLDESTHTFDLIGAMGGAWENNTYRWEMRRDGETTWIPVGTERTLTTPPLTEDTWFRRVAIASPTNIITSNEALVTVRDGVRLGGIIWAKSNVDMPGTFAVNPEDFGMYYKWNSRMGWSSTDPMVNSNGGTVWDSSTSPPGTDWDTANDPCPDGWRMPTQNEFAYFVGTAALGENPWWVEDWNGTGANGSLIGVAPNQIFLPAAGLRAQGTGGGLLDGENSSAIYWGGTYGGNNSGTLLVGPSIIWFIPTFEHIGHAYPIRCVADIIL
jgi:hypothetical protein